MNYRIFKKLIKFTPNQIIEIEVPETLIDVRIESTTTNSNSLINIIGLESYGNVYPTKIIKLMILSEVGTVEHTVDYEPKVFNAGTLVLHNGIKFYCFLLS
jgi:hypothetical protein